MKANEEQTYLDSGFVKLHRKIVDWEWFKDPITCKVFIYCLIKANYEDKQWQGITIERGSFLTSISRISEDNGLTTQQTRTAIKHLISTKELTKCTTPKYTIITVSKYNLYNEVNKVFNKQLTTTKKDKNNNKEEKEKSIEENNIKIFGVYRKVRLYDWQYTALKNQFKETDINSWIEYMDSYLNQTNNSYKDCYIKLKEWINKDLRKASQKYPLEKEIKLPNARDKKE